MLQNITDISFTTRLHWCRFRTSPAGWWRAWTAGWYCSPSRSCNASRSSRRTAGMLRRRFLSLRRRKSARMCSTWSVSRSPQLLLTDKILLNCRLKRGSQLRFAPPRNSTRKRSPYSADRSVSTNNFDYQFISTVARTGQTQFRIMYFILFVRCTVVWAGVQEGRAGAADSGGTEPVRRGDQLISAAAAPTVKQYSNHNNLSLQTENYTSSCRRTDQSNEQSGSYLVSGIFLSN